MRLKRLHIGILFLLVLAQSLRGQYHIGSAEIAYRSDFEKAVFSSLSYDSTPPAMAFLLAISPDMDEGLYREYRAELQMACNSALRAMPKRGNEKDRIFQLFQYLKKTHLKTYEQVVSLPELLREGKYNCVSASALVALTLDAAGIPYQLREMHKHIYIYAKAGDDYLRLETTDTGLGVSIARKRELRKFLSSFGQRRKTLGEYRNVEANIDLHRLAGLQYYNEGLRLMDESRSAEAYDQFAKAWLLYPCKRVGEMLETTALTEAETGMALVRQHEVGLGLRHLERAWRVLPEEGSLKNGIIAAVSKSIEFNDDHEQALTVLRKSMERFPFLAAEPVMREEKVDLLLVVAYMNFEKDLEHGMRLIEELEQYLEAHPEALNRPLAETVYVKGALQLIKAGNLNGAEELLEKAVEMMPENEGLSKRLSQLQVLASR